MATFNITEQQQQEEAKLSALAEKPSIMKSVSGALGKLSTREKALIWGLIIVAAIMAMIFFLVMPANDRLTEAQSVRDTLTMEENSTRLTIAAMPSNETMLQEAQARYDTYIAKYQAPMLPEDIDRMITTLLEDSGLSVATLSLNPSVTEGVATFTGQAASWEIPNPTVVETTATGTGSADETAAGAEGAQAGADASAESGTEGATGSEANTGTDESANALDAAVTEDSSAAASGDSSSSGVEAQVQVYTVDVSAIGVEENYYALLDRVIPLTWLKINSSSYVPITSTSTNLEISFSISFKIYVNPSATVKQP